jgi:hypothetical protein
VGLAGYVLVSLPLAVVVGRLLRDPRDGAEWPVPPYPLSPVTVGEPQLARIDRPRSRRSRSSLHT